MGEARQQIQVVWFKRDLRIHDHAPLVAAAAGPVLPLYVVEPDYWALPDVSRRHWHYTHDALSELAQALATRGAPLLLRVGEVVAVLEDVRQRLGAFTLWSHEETGNGWTFARDLRVQAWCRAQGVVWHELANGGVVRRLRSRDGWAELRDARMAQPLMAAPDGLRAPAVALPQMALPAKDAPLFGTQAIGRVQAGGRAAAEACLASFLATRAERYMQCISKPGSAAQYCSRLSAHLAYGVLSVREVEQATKARLASLRGVAEPEAASLRRNLSAFLSRLAWHCHFIQKLEQQPQIEFRCMHPAFEGMREPHHREDWLRAWHTGQTGYPLVDACMRALHAEGWITFRMRAMLVSFASYHLWLDWRQTAPLMAQLFTDYEPGIHYAQFQMQSGVTGINAVRMYNPIKQSMDQDPQGKFIRRFVSELRQVPDAFIHEPWRMETPPAAYPPPLVNHEAAIRHARAQIAARWQMPEFREQARDVNRRLGSRSNQPKRSAPRREKTTTQQLSFDLG